MTYEEEIKYILETKRYPSQKFNSILKTVGRLLFGILALSTSFLFCYLFFATNELDKANRIIQIFIIIIFYYGVAILSAIKDELTSDRYFIELTTKKNAKENLLIIKTILNSNFKIKDLNIDDENNIIIAQTKISILTWGDIITIISDNNRVLINSKASRGQFFSYGQEKRNIKKIKMAFLKNYD